MDKKIIYQKGGKSHISVYGKEYECTDYTHIMHPNEFGIEYVFRIRVNEPFPNHVFIYKFYTGVWSEIIEEAQHAVIIKAKNPKRVINNFLMRCNALINSGKINEKTHEKYNMIIDYVSGCLLLDDDLDRFTRLELCKEEIRKLDTENLVFLCWVQSGKVSKGYYKIKLEECQNKS